MDSSLSDALDSICKQIEDLLNDYKKSVKLQKYFSEMLISFFYANLIQNFFSNLTQNNIEEQSLPYGMIGKINNSFSIIKSKCKKSLSKYRQKDSISLKDYDEFKNKIKTGYQEFYSIIQYIEDEVNYPKQERKLNAHIKTIKNAGISSKKSNINVSMSTIMFEHQIMSSDLTIHPLEKPLTKAIVHTVETVSSKITKCLDNSLNKMFNYEQKRKSNLERIIFDIWSTPFVLMQGLIKLSSEAVEAHINNLADSKHEVDDYKLDALLKLFSRAIQTSDEILVLAQHGYADGALARWRSLHETTVIALFLEDNGAYVSERFLSHIHVSRYSDALSYKEKYRKLGYAPLGKKLFHVLKHNFDAVKQKYGDDFTKQYGWIPLELSVIRNFHALEKHVNLDKFRPYYKKASHLIHAGPNSFFRLGQHENQEYLFPDPSPYGIADSLGNCAISLLHITLCILNYSPTFDSILKMKVISEWNSRVLDALDNVSPDDYLEPEKYDSDNTQHME